LNSTRKVRRALERVADPQLQVIPLVSLALYEHIRESNRGSAQGDAMATGVVLLLLGVPVLLLTLL